MSRLATSRLGIGWVLLALAGVAMGDRGTARGAVTSQEVERAIRDGVRFLKDQQREDGSWLEVEHKANTGTTSLVTLALLTAGERPDSPTIRAALDYLRHFGPQQLRNTYAISLQTMALAAGDPDRDRLRILANVDWLETAQIKLGEKMTWPGTWTYSDAKFQQGDNSNTQYALLGLNAASEVGVAIKPEVWTVSRRYFEVTQNRDGGWGYKPGSPSTGSMSCAGISSLIITGSKLHQGQEYLQGEAIQNCGKGGFNPVLLRGLDWLANRFQVGQNYGQGQVWKFYYLYALERAGRLAGVRFFGPHDWYRQGAEELVHEQNKLSGFWRGFGQENELIATSFALLFLAKGRAPVLINKVRHAPLADWNNDADDIRNLVGIISRDWKNLLTWQIVDPGQATVADLLQAPILFFNGHHAPEFSAIAKENLRQFIEQGGLIFADACCGDREFDRGFRQLMKEIFPQEGFQLRPLSESHPVWRAKHVLSPEIHPLWGIEHGCRTVVIYSPLDLSCYWNQSEHSPANPAVIKAIKVGQNVIDYATGREMPADKLTPREVRALGAEAPRRGTLRIGKLKHAGDWNIAPQAIANLMDALRKPPFRFDVGPEKDLFPRDPGLIHYPLIYIHGRGALSFPREDLEALRRHLDLGAGTLFADAACGSTAFDATFRRFVAELLPSNPLVPIPRDDELYTKVAREVGINLKDCQYTKAAGGHRDLPQLEGVKINGHWSIIYSKYDIGCALERHTGIECKGYSYDSALKIAAIIVVYSTLP